MGAAFTLGVFLGTSQPACPDDVSALTDFSIQTPDIINLPFLMRTPRPKEADQFAQGHEAEPSLSDS